MNKRIFLLAVISLVALMLLNSVPAFADYPSAEDGVVSWWRLDGDFSDSIGSNDGTGYNFDDGWVAGKNGDALEFDSGEEQYVGVADDASLSFGGGNFSVEFWVKTNASDNPDILGKKGIVDIHCPGWVFYIDTGKVVFDINGDANPFVLSTSTVNDGDWHHVVGVMEGDDFLIYFDGGEEDSDNVGSVGDIDNPEDLTFGYNDYGAGTYFSGVLDDVRIWNKSLNSTEIQTLFELAPSSNLPPSIYYTDSIPAIDPAEGRTVTVLFNVSISDPQGYSDIVLANVSANMTSESDRAGSCVAGDVINDTAINYSCSFDMQFYDASGSWSVNVYAEDAGSLSDSQWTSFTYNTLTAWNMTPHSISFPETFVGNSNLLASEYTIMQNTGNDDLDVIEMNSTDLVGVNFSETIVANNFTMNTAGACGGTGLSSNIFVQVGSATLPRGVSSFEELYYCFELVPQIIADVYDTSVNGQWTLRSVG